MIKYLTVELARLLKLPYGTLQKGAPADMVIFDPDAEWTVDPSKFYSKGKNTPLAGVTLRGKVTATIVEGKLIYADVEA
jgi:dihydroorotase